MEAGKSFDVVNPSEAGWHADPFGRHERRWWDGDRWSEKVADGDISSIDPPGIDLSPAAYDLDSDEPVSPITDAHLPITAPSPWGQLTFAFGVVVLLALIALTVLFVTGVL